MLIYWYISEDVIHTTVCLVKKAQHFDFVGESVDGRLDELNHAVKLLNLRTQQLNRLGVNLFTIRVVVTLHHRQCPAEEILVANEVVCSTTNKIAMQYNLYHFQLRVLNRYLEEQRHV